MRSLLFSALVASLALCLSSPLAARAHAVAPIVSSLLPATMTASEDLGPLSASICDTELPATKRSCSQCVTAGYIWRTSKRAIKTADNYEGGCVDPSAVLSLPITTALSHSNWHLAVTSLDGCPAADFDNVPTRQSASFNTLNNRIAAQADDCAPWQKTNITDLPWTTFQAMSKEAKQARLWKAITASSYPMDELPTAALPTNVSARIFVPWYPPETYLWPSDILALDRQGVKIFHTYGIVGTGQVTIDSQSIFSGLLGSSTTPPTATPVIIRLSQAAVQTNISGLAVKFLIDGLPSENVVAIHSLDEQPTSYFFTNELNTVNPMPTTPTLQFLNVVLRGEQELVIPADRLPASAETIPLDRVTMVNADGSTPEHISTPAKIFFVPTDAVKNATDPLDARDFRVVLSELPVGITLYELYGCPSLDSCDNSTDGNSHYIGELSLTSQLVIGPYGDQQLHFQHQTAVNAKPGSTCPFAALRSRS